jgi:hypothetical protein
MQGELPTHPELLDWLALDFMNNGWDIKRLVKEIVMSSTYRQSAEISKDKQTIDPENIYLSRSPRMRLPAELIKDHMMATSSLLNPEIGGPSVKPYQPKGIWESSTSGRGVLAYYMQDHGSKLYRRGMYNFIKRTVPPPSMLMFDASNRDQCEVKRMRTNTPLQALVLMNDPQVLEASRVLAEKLMSENASADGRIEKAVRLILCRKGEQKELTLLKKYFEEENSYFKTNEGSAEKLLSQGEYPRANVADKNATAALMQVIQTLYNTDEAITR